MNKPRRIPLIAAIGAFLLCGDLSSAFARNAKDDARAAARKASGLAADGKCEQAVPLYAKAYKALKDAALLFNRAECLRKMGSNAEAIKDYEQFLADMPTAPNRPLVEKRIEELRDAKSDKPAPTVVTAPPAPTPQKPPVAVAPVVSPAAKQPAPAPANASEQTGLIGMEDSSAAMPNLDTPEPRAPVESLVNAPAPAEDAKDSGVSPWVWVGLGAVVVAGAVVGGFLIFGGDETQVPKTALGNYKF